MAGRKPFAETAMTGAERQAGGKQNGHTAALAMIDTFASEKRSESVDG